MGTYHRRRAGRPRKSNGNEEEQISESLASRKAVAVEMVLEVLCVDVGACEIHYCKATCDFQQKIQITVWRYIPFFRRQTILWTPHSSLCISLAHLVENTPFLRKADSVLFETLPHRVRTSPFFSK